MGKLYLAANDIKNLGNTASHLQLVYEDGNGNWFEVEVQANTNEGTGLREFWTYPANGTIDEPNKWRPHGGEKNTAYVNEDGSIADPNHYKRIELDIPDGMTAEQVWELALQFNASFQAHGATINYNILQNSNSFIRTLLETIGYENAETLIQQVSTGAPTPGSATNVLTEGAETDGDLVQQSRISLTMEGTDGDDIISSGRGNDNLGGGAGDDIITVGDGNDIVRPGTGNNTIYLNGGFSNTVILLGDKADYVVEHPETGYFTYTNTVTGDSTTIFHSNEMNNQRVIFGGDTDTCFPAGTLITLANGRTKVIEAIAVGDVVMSFGADGVLRPAPVTQLLDNVTTEWLKLSNGTVVTLGHRYLRPDGSFAEIKEIIAGDGRIVAKDGEVMTVTAETAQEMKLAA